jgi:hypothetical protein
MTTPLQFLSATPRFGLPNLFVGQAQKEFTVNEALARLDGLLHPAIAGVANAPPAAPDDGECWIIGTGATGAWAAHAESLACRQAGNWLYIPPQPGMRVYDVSLGAVRVFGTFWSFPAGVAQPDGGATVDTEARATISALITALVNARILSAV